MKFFGKSQFALFRILFGLYLSFHFAQLIPYGEELFSRNGMIQDVQLLPTYGVHPNILFVFDEPLYVQLFLTLLTCSALLLMIGWHRRSNALFLFYGWTCLLNRNVFIANPGLAYVGWLLLACCLVQSGERIGFWMTERHRIQESVKSTKRWEVSNPIFYGSILLMNIGYTVSGLHKIGGSPSWINGTALTHVLSSALARENCLHSFLLFYLPPVVLKYMTWLSLFGEVSALFLGCFYHLRKYYWMFFMSFHLGILFLINFSDLTFGMLMIHLFTFEARWFDWSMKLLQKYDWLLEQSHTIPANATKTSSVLVVEAADAVAGVTTLEVAKQKSREQFQWLDDLSNHPPKTELSLSKIRIVVVVIIVVLLSIIVGYVENNFVASVYSNSLEFVQLSWKMIWGLLFIVCVGFVLMILERIFPDQPLPHVPGWWHWVALINVFQFFAVILATFTWEKWLQETNYFTNTTKFHLRDYVSAPMGGFLAYLLNQWLFYFYHLARHEIDLWWIVFHQFHHSATRIETITSFYKHPLEIVVDSQIMAVLIYAVLGLTSESSVWLSIFSACGEFFYHLNMKTPQWIGYIFQRPESHRCHHLRNKRYNCPNFSDFPLWDILGGTFENPAIMDLPTGFSPHREVKRWEMLRFEDVLWGKAGTRQTLCKAFRKTVSYALVIWGCLNCFAFFVHSDAIKGIGFASVSSPLPLVFSHYNGIETFATKFHLNITTITGQKIQKTLDAKSYSLILGPYNRRNVYSALFSHGPFFDSHNRNLLTLRQQILYYGICQPGSLVQELRLPYNIADVQVLVTSKSQSGQWILSIECEDELFSTF